MSSDLFKALADPTRRTILDELVEADGQTLFEICGRLTMKHGLSSSRQAISQHLDVLEAAGLVSTRREGRYKFHHVDTTPLHAITTRWISPQREDLVMPRITITSVFVDDQEKARRFYTELLGFQVKHDLPLGGARWLTVVSPEDPDGAELLLEPDGHPAVRPYKEALVADGIPATYFEVDDVRAEAERLRAAGVQFTQEPAQMGEVIVAVLDDTCGNLIQLLQHV